MKYLILIATLAAFIGTATAATAPQADCCKGKQKCCSSGCCKK
jgi:hypothetical protein